MRTTAVLPALVVAALAITACGSEDVDEPIPTTLAPETANETGSDDQSGGGDTGDESGEPGDEPGDEAGDIQRYPDVIDATAERAGDTWTISATLSSPYDTPERYADAWRVIGPDDTVYGERVLAHDHANEQPFTRSQSGIEIPADVTEVVIEGRDLEFGYGGGTFELTLPA